MVDCCWLWLMVDGCFCFFSLMVDCCWLMVDG